MRRVGPMLMLALLAGCTDVPVSLGAGQVGGGGGGAMAGGTTWVAPPAGGCPIDAYEALAREIEAVDDAGARQALRFQRDQLERAVMGSETVRRKGVGQLVAAAAQFEEEGLIAPEQAGRLQALARCYAGGEPDGHQ